MSKTIRGHITYEASVWCGCPCDCQRWDALSGHRPARQAKSEGWTFTRAHGYICPNCQTCLSGEPEGGTS